MKRPQDLVEAIQRGGMARERALEAIFRENRSYVYGVLYKRGVPSLDYNVLYSGAMMELLLSVLKGSFKNQGRRSFGSFLATVAHRMWIHNLRDQRKQERLQEMLSHFVPQSEEPLAEQDDQEEKFAALQGLIEQLSVKEREMVEMRWFMEASYEEIRQVFGYESEQVARNLACRALEKLRRLARQHPLLRNFFKVNGEGNVGNQSEAV